MNQRSEMNKINELIEQNEQNEWNELNEQKELLRAGAHIRLRRGVNLLEKSLETAKWEADESKKTRGHWGQEAVEAKESLKQRGRWRESRCEMRRFIVKWGNEGIWWEKCRWWDYLAKEEMRELIWVVYPEKQIQRAGSRQSNRQKWQMWNESKCQMWEKELEWWLWHVAFTMAKERKHVQMRFQWRREQKWKKAWHINVKWT